MKGELKRGGGNCNGTGVTELIRNRVVLDQSDKVECEEFARAIRLIMRQCDK